MEKYIKTFYKYTRYNKAGNRGGSLRRTEVFYTTCVEFYSKQSNNKVGISSHHYTKNEDFFWSL